MQESLSADIVILIMNDPLPISLLVDDSCPLIHVYRNHQVDVHHREPKTADGRLLRETIPNDFLDRFCDVVQAHGMAGKLSIVPAPAGLGNVAAGIAGHDPRLTRAWMLTAMHRLSKRFDFTPEGLTHNLAVDMATGGFHALGESDWSQTQTRAALTPYLTRQLEILKTAGVDATGFTSPWVFGIKVEPEYIAAMMAAQLAVYGRTFSWYFLHMLHDTPESRPWVALRDGAAVIVSVPSTVDDFFWHTIESPRTDAAYIGGIADRILTRDGRRGGLRRVLSAGGWPVLLTHWQSLFSNGLETGLAALDEVGRRIASLPPGTVAWRSCSELARLTTDAC